MNIFDDTLDPYHRYNREQEECALTAVFRMITLDHKFTRPNILKHTSHLKPHGVSDLRWAAMVFRRFNDLGERQV